jgi:iron complex transport system ATP-binding protein
MSTGPSAPVALAAHEVSVGYGAREVLHRVSLEVAAGELLAIVGPNGAGKSTLLRVLGGSLRPWAGSVELLGRPLREFDRRGIARRVACVAQENAAAFHFTVLEVVLMGRAPHLAPLRFEGRRDLELAHAALARFGLLPLAGRFVQDLSGGERKRVFLARALVQEPAVALLDEPTAFLDLKHVDEVFELFAELRAERGLAVVATLHDLNAASLYADRVLLLKDGAAIGCGRPEEILTVANLREVYDTEVFVARSPVTGAVVVFPAGRDAHGRVIQ